jgi:hypothetical protein
MGALADACAGSDDSDASDAPSASRAVVSAALEPLAMLSCVEEALMTQLWRMLLRFATSGHLSRSDATTPVHRSWGQRAIGASFTGPSVTGGDGFGEFPTEIVGVTTRDEPAAVRIGNIGHLHPDGV